MYVEHSGWNRQHGSFSYKIFIDETRLDYAIHFRDGSVSNQDGPFQMFSADWNNDGDVYELFGAWFREPSGRGEFWTPEQMVMALVDSRERSSSTVSHITGITLPTRDFHPSLDEVIQQRALRTSQQDTTQTLCRSPLDDCPHEDR